MAMTPSQRRRHDDALSERSISLDPGGYFVISLDREAGEIIADHYSNSINDAGLATDPDSGEVLTCSTSTAPRQPIARYRGVSAKALGMALTETAKPSPMTCLDHALYLGRELQKAERCLEDGSPYIQD